MDRRPTLPQLPTPAAPAVIVRVLDVRPAAGGRPLPSHLRPIRIIETKRNAGGAR